MRGKLPYIGVFCLAILIGISSLAGEYVLDDNLAISGSECVTNGIDIGKTFSRNFWCQDPTSVTIDAWRPLTVLVWSILWNVGDGAPWLFHLMGLLAHALCCVLLMRLITRFNAALWARLTAGVWFAVMPIHVDAVASGVGTAEMFSLASMLGALLLAHRYMSDGGNKRFALTLLLVLCACLCKESSVLIAPLILWMGLCLAKEESRKRILILGAASCGIVALYVLWRYLAIDTLTAEHVGWGANPLKYSLFGRRAITALDLVSRYVQTSLVGIPLSADYSYNQIPVGVVSVRMFAGIAIVAGIAFVAFKHRRSALGFAAGWLGASLFFVSNLLVVLPAIFAERIFYAGSAAFVLFITLLLAKLFARNPQVKGLVLGVGVLAALFWAATSFMQTRYWKNESMLYLRAVKSAPNSAKANQWVANEFAKRGDYKRALAYNQRAHDIFPAWSKPLLLFGSIASVHKQDEKAQFYYNLAFEAEPHNCNNLEVMTLWGKQAKRMDVVMEWYKKHKAARPGGHVHPPLE